MKGTIETPRVPKIVMSLIAHLFFDVIMTLEKSNSDQVVFGKQLDIRKCLKDVQNFVLQHPYGKFSIEVLESPKRDVNDPALVMKFKNFGSEIPGVIPMMYYIILDETYTNFQAYQSSVDGILISLKV
jgi:hypothetical protein